MLVLSRQRDQTIMIGDEVEITVVDVRGDKVRIGISAPPRIAVHRKEVHEAIQAENQAAARLAGSDAGLLGGGAMDVRGGGAERIGALADPVGGLAAAGGAPRDGRRAAG